MSSFCASAYVSVNCTRFTQLPVVDVRLYKGGAAENFRFALLTNLRSDPSVSKVVQQLGFALFCSATALEELLNLWLVEVYLSKSVKSRTQYLQAFLL